MAYTHVWQRTVNVAGVIYVRNDTITSESEVRLTPTLGIATNQLVEAQFRYAALKSVHIEVSAAATIKTNSSSVPDQTFTMGPADPLDWNDAEQAANPFTHDVTALYVTSAAEPNLVIEILKDATP